MEAQYDREADALYLRLRDAAVARSIEIDDYRVIDLSDAGDPVGLEILYPFENLAIASIAREYGFGDLLDEIDDVVSAELGETGPPATVALTTATMRLIGVGEMPSQWTVSAVPSSGTGMTTRIDSVPA